MSSRRDEMSKFVISVSEDLEEKCLKSMFHDNIDLSRLMVHSQQVEVSL